MTDDDDTRAVREGLTAPAGTAAVVFGMTGLTLSRDERAFFQDAAPFGFILFARNIETPAQVKALVAELRAAVGWRAPVFIDQEGGRVARLKPPHWRAHLAAGAFADRVDRPAPGAALWAESALWEALALRSRLIADDLAALDIDVVCAPVADLRVDGAADVIGDRAVGRKPGDVAARCEVMIGAYLAGGVLPVVKHIPGHGRAAADSHAELPIVAASRSALAEDVAPFRALADAPMAMTAHVAYEAVDPGVAATVSETVVREVIRGEIGFDGLLVTDDLAMGALAGGLDERAAAAHQAGCDLSLHCWGDIGQMTTVMNGVPALDGLARSRAAAALARRRPPEPFDRRAAQLRLGALEADLAAGGARLDPTERRLAVDDVVS